MESILLLYGTLQLHMMVPTTGMAGCPSLLCHKVKTFHETEFSFTLQYSFWVDRLADLELALMVDVELERS